MPPHCDTLDGPVVKACMMAFEKDNVNPALAWVPESAEPEVREAFMHVQQVRKKSDSEMNMIAERWFFETVVRLHRGGEGEPYNGLKPAGLDWGPVLPLTEIAIHSGDPGEVIRFISDSVQDELAARFEKLKRSKDFNPDDIASAREYVKAELGFVLFSHHLWSYVRSGGTAPKHDE